jgi:hypothetical protein
MRDVAVENPFPGDRLAEFIRPLLDQAQRVVFSVNAIFEQRFVQKTATFQQVRIEWQHDIQIVQMRRWYSERQIDLTLKSKSRTEAAGIGAIADERFETVVGWTVRTTVGAAERPGILVDDLRIDGDQRNVLCLPGSTISATISGSITSSSHVRTIKSPHAALKAVSHVPNKPRLTGLRMKRMFERSGRVASFAATISPMLSCEQSSMMTMSRGE